jgi:hypothetical protein
MNFPPAPLSISPKVSAVLFDSVSFIEIGIDNEFDSICGTFTEKTSSTGDTDADAVLPFKNPLVQHRHRNRSFRRRYTQRLSLGYTPLILSAVVSLNKTGEL